MGGIGSGRRRHHSANDTTEDYRAIDVRRWQRDGLLTSNDAFGWNWWCDDGQVVASIIVQPEADHVVLSYSRLSGAGEWQDENYPLYLDWTPCNLGGSRPWFICPAAGCGRRVAILYWGAIFACGHCFQLAYPSQRESHDKRADRRADRIREKLGWDPGIFGKHGKPKGMHWRTYERLAAEHDAFVRISNAIFDLRHGLTY